MNEEEAIELHDLAARSRAHAQYMLRRFRESRQHILARAVDREEVARTLDRVEARLIESEAADAGEMYRLRDLLGWRPPLARPQATAR